MKKDFGGAGDGETGSIYHCLPAICFPGRILDGAPGRRGRDTHGTHENAMKNLLEFYFRFLQGPKGKRKGLGGWRETRLELRRLIGHSARPSLRGQKDFPDFP
jgi:hypothetical protein